LLFVEDEPRQLQLMQSFLKGEGFTVLTARDGAEAVEVHRRFKDEIAVVILDLGLAKMNGWQAFQMMKKLNPRVKGILASGYLSPDVEPQSTKNGNLRHRIMKEKTVAE
jgi:DNA-binding response OmpR family regulator